MCLQRHAALGNKWAELATYLPGRPQLSVRNRWNGYLSKRSASSTSRQPSTRPASLPKRSLSRDLPTASTTDADQPDSKRLKGIPFAEIERILEQDAIEDFEQLIAEGQIPDLNATHPITGESILVIACKKGRIDMARLLINTGADIESAVSSAPMMYGGIQLPGNLCDAYDYVSTYTHNILLYLYNHTSILMHTYILAYTYIHVFVQHLYRSTVPKHPTSLAATSFLSLMQCLTA